MTVAALILVVTLVGAQSVLPIPAIRATQEEAVKTSISEPLSTKPVLNAIPPGTFIELSLAETISTRTHVKGDIFQLTVSRALLVDGLEILPVGSKVIGEVTSSETKSAFGVSGKLEARLLYAILPEGTLRLNGKLAARGKGGTTEAVLAFAAIGSIAFVVTGKSAKIEKGTELLGIIGLR